MKNCKKCEQLLPYDEFEYRKRYRVDGTPACNVCRSCYYKKRNEWLCGYRKENKEKIWQNTKKWRLKNKEKSLGYLRDWQQRNRDKTRKIATNYYYENYDAVRSRRRAAKYHLRRSENAILADALRARIRDALKNQGTIKSEKTLCLIGCSIDFLSRYIESKFAAGMSWNNHGMRGWHIDHIIPCNSFDLSDLNEQKKCFHYSNMQPLWAKDNLSKADKIISVA